MTAAGCGEGLHPLAQQFGLLDELLVELGRLGEGNVDLGEHRGEWWTRPWTSLLSSLTESRQEVPRSPCVNAAWTSNMALCTASTGVSMSGLAAALGRSTRNRASMSVYTPVTRSRFRRRRSRRVLNTTWVALRHRRRPAGVRHRRPPCRHDVACSAPGWRSSTSTRWGSWRASQVALTTSTSRLPGGRLVVADDRAR